MDVNTVTEIIRGGLFTIIKCSAPMLLVSLVVGLTVSVFQTVTSIQEQTLTFVPKILAVFVTIMLLGSWMLNNMAGYMASLWGDFSLYV